MGRVLASATVDGFSLADLGSGVSGCLIPLLIVGWVIWVIVQRGFQIQRLVKGGVPGTGQVVKRFRQHRRGGGGEPYLRYAFQDSYGRAFERKVGVSEEEFERYREGDSIDIVYLPGKPRVSATKAMVELSRSATRGA